MSMRILRLCKVSFFFVLNACLVVNRTQILFFVTTGGTGVDGWNVMAKKHRVRPKLIRIKAILGRNQSKKYEGMGKSISLGG